MFTGIITAVGIIRDVSQRANKDTQFLIGVPPEWSMDNIDLGASICCSGCCLTVIDKTNDSFVVDVSGESLSKTNLGSWRKGSEINLERSLKMGDEFGGHIVSGHVDGLAKLISLRPEDGSHRLQFETPSGFEKFVAPKGSVTLNGISLTVNEVIGKVFGVNIIPHTWNVTNFRNLKVGDDVNFEVDVIARYVARQMGAL
jgi:riboflavin synthase